MFQVKGMAGHKWFELGRIPSRTSARSPGVEILNFSPTLVTLVPQLEVLLKSAREGLQEQIA